MENSALTGPRQRYEVWIEILVLFSLLERYDSRFGFNGYYRNLQGQQFPGPAIYEGWHHPALVEYMLSRGVEHKDFLEAFHLEEIEWNLRRLLRRYEESACVRPLTPPYQKRGFEPKGEPYAA